LYLFLSRKKNFITLCCSCLSILIVLQEVNK
jgi:hypothetical protein